MLISFYKMHALGNDFVIVDNTKLQITFTKEQIEFLCHRRFGIGCDQLVLISEIRPMELVSMAIYNSDGSSAEACGNATRCVGLHLMKKYLTNSVNIRTQDRTLEVKYSESDKNSIIANMGKVKFNWNEIPLATADVNPQNISFPDLNLFGGIAVNVGNPHVVFFIDSFDDIDIAKLGSIVENSSIFPNRTNVEFAKVIDDSTVRMKVWERGSGVTLACGTGAVATFSAAIIKNLIDGTKKAKIILDGGTLLLSHNPEKNIILEGAAVEVFEGKIEL